MNNDIQNISVEEIKAGCAKNDVITVEIKDEAKLLIEAHNASNLAHKELFDSINDKMDEFSSSVANLEENAVLASDVPTKISDLENDLGFVNEEKLADAIDIMGLVNGEEIDKTVDEIRNEIKNSVEMSSNTILNELNNVESKIPDSETIIHTVARGNKYIILTPPASGGTFTVPADGIMYMGGKNNTGDYGWINVKTMPDEVYRYDVSYLLANEILGIEFIVKKGEILKFSYGCFSFLKLYFFYLNGNEPADETNEGE